MPRSFDPFSEPFSPKGSKIKSAHTDKPQPLLQAQKVDRLSPLQSNSGVTYRVILDAPPDAGKGKDKRRAPPRKRTRLRCGKLLDQHGKFLIECQVHDRSVYGAHLRLVSGISLPRRIKFYDDEQRTLIDAEVIWRQKGDVGIQYLTKLDAQAVRLGKRSALDGKYYAVN
jgi:hypothetical protein